MAACCLWTKHVDQFQTCRKGVMQGAREFLSEGMYCLTGARPYQGPQGLIPMRVTKPSPVMTRPSSSKKEKEERKNERKKKKGRKRGKEGGREGEI